MTDPSGELAARRLDPAVEAPPAPGHERRPAAVDDRIGPSGARPEGTVGPPAFRAPQLEGLALAAILLVSMGLNGLGLDRQGFGNTYYAAAVRSMLTSWHNFFFVSFDSAGFMAVDKPPIGLWVQAASAWLFGFDGPALFLPQALSGLLSVALLYYLVRRVFGPAAGLLAGLALAVTPISVVANRNNTMDSQLVLVLLLGAWAATLAAESGRWRPLLASAALVGLGYNVKMLQAFLVAPAFWLAYLWLAPVRLRDRVFRLSIASALLLAVSLSWSLVVDATAASMRPYVGSSGTNSALSLALGYNGLTRLTQALAPYLPALKIGGLTLDLTVAPAFAPQIGEPGLLRLLREGLADQASWLLPLALLGMGVSALQLIRPAGPSGSRKSDPTPDTEEQTRRQRVALVIWGDWLLAWGAYFSLARFYHLYYLVMLGPAVSALAGIGTISLWRAYRQRGLLGWALPLALLATAVVQATVLASYPAWSSRLTPIVLAASAVSVLALLVWRGADNLKPAIVGAVTGCLVLLVAPTIWSAVSARDGNGAAWLPQAGPSLGAGGGGARNPGPASGPGAGAFTQSGGPAGRFNRGGSATGQPPQGGSRGFPGRGGGVGALTFAGDQWDGLDPALVQYLLAHQDGARFLVATPSSTYASLFELMSDQPAMALGGYQGWDRVLTPPQLADEVSNGVVRFFLLSGQPAFNGPGASLDATADLRTWVQSTCRAVPSQEWQAASSAVAAPRAAGRLGLDQQLYDCAAS
jgi:4-amino-4-deoxy-L-arabinose transferase-like glycosyltransferase